MGSCLAWAMLATLWKHWDSVCVKICAENCQLYHVSASFGILLLHLLLDIILPRFSCTFDYDLSLSGIDPKRFGNLFETCSMSDVVQKQRCSRTVRPLALTTPAE